MHVVKVTTPANILLQSVKWYLPRMETRKSALFIVIPTLLELQNA